MSGRQMYQNMGREMYQNIRAANDTKYGAENDQAASVLGPPREGIPLKKGNI